MTQTVDVDVIDEICDLLFGDLQPQPIHHGHQLLGRYASVIVLVEQRERFSQLWLAAHTQTHTVLVSPDEHRTNFARVGYRVKHSKNVYCKMFQQTLRVYSYRKMQPNCP